MAKLHRSIDSRGGSEKAARVLVVDDQPRARFLVRAAVGEVGYEVVAEATDGEKALGEVAIHEPDLVVMDYRMPVMDGLEATRTIKERYPTVQVIAHTSVTDAELQQDFLAAGACEHVAKGDVSGLTAALKLCAV